MTAHPRVQYPAALSPRMTSVFRNVIDKARRSSRFDEEMACLYRMLNSRRIDPDPELHTVNELVGAYNRWLSPKSAFYDRERFVSFLEELLHPREIVIRAALWVALKDRAVPFYGWTNEELARMMIG